MSVIPSQWYRIDKGDGRVLAVNRRRVADAAYHSFDNAAEVIATGRFSTPFAIYSLGSEMSEAEQNQPRGLSMRAAEAECLTTEGK